MRDNMYVSQQKRTEIEKCCSVNKSQLTDNQESLFLLPTLTFINLKMSYKLTYFDMRERAECIRMIFAAAGVKFEDNRIKGENWPALKPTTTWGQVPVLEVGGSKTLAQTVTICRYLGRKFNLIGEDEWEAAKCDEYVDAINDLFVEWAKYVFEKDETKKSKLHQDFTDNQLHKFLTKFNDLKGKNGGNFLIGKKLTWSDVFIADKLDRLTQSEGVDVLDKYPNLKQFRATVLSQPNLKAYVDQRAP